MTIDEAIKDCEENDYEQIAEWLRELKAYREADEEIRQLSQVWEEGAGIAKCIVILNKHLREVTEDEVNEETNNQYDVNPLYYFIKWL